MKIMILIFILAIFSKISLADVMINEIMADPVADETLNEWLELYNNGSEEVNVSNWIIGDDSDNDTIEGGLFNKEGTVIEAFGYAIITDEATRVYNNFNVSEEAIRLYVDDAAIGNGLSNSGEAFYLYDNKRNLIDKVNYDKTKEDLSWAFINGSFFLSEVTAGYNNNGSLVIETEDGCDFQVAFILASEVFDNSSAFNFKIRASKVKGTKTNFTGRASIKDLFGTLIREYKPWTNQSITRQRTSSEFTPNLEEGKSYEMNANITLQCNDTNLDNNFDTKIITIKGAPLEKESSLSIENILDLGSDKKAQFGDTIRVRTSIYKGDTTKNSVALWIESDKGDRLSKQSKLNIPEKFTKNEFTVPIQIKPNCDRDFEDDDYIIKMSGLDAETEEEVEIEDIDSSLCKEIKVEEKTKTALRGFSYEIIQMPDEINVGEKFNIMLRLDNNDENDIPIKAWSYVYRGPKSYSGEREENKKEFVLKQRSSNVVELSNIVEEAEPGDYKVKILINKNYQKTNNEITESIKINGIEESNLIVFNEPSDSKFEALEAEEAEIKYDLGLVYESSTEKPKKLIPIFIIIFSVLLNVVLIWRR